MTISAPFDTCLAFTIGPFPGAPLGQEGGWADNPADPGGATYRGATLAAYRDWMNDEGLTKDQLRHLTSDDLWAFYHAKYWMPVNGNDLGTGADLMVFDFGVTAGVRRSGIVLQTVLGVTPDGAIGPQTLAKLHGINDPAGLVAKLGAAQSAYYRACAGFPTFGKGWAARTAAREAAALAALKQAQLTAPAPPG